MKRFKFKSLTMRIWTTFTAIILIIILGISIFYLAAFRRIEQNSRIQDLKVVHDMLLNGNNLNQPLNRFDEMRNLKGNDNFIINIGENKSIQILDMGRRQGPPQSSGVNVNDMRVWIAGFAKDSNMYEKEFQEYYNHTRVIFIISSIDNGMSGKSYLVSSVQDVENNNLLYMVAIIGAVFIVIGFFTSKLVANYISKPLKQLEDYTVRIARKDWKEPIHIKNEDEIGRLADAMNHMQKSLKHAEEEEKMFLQSISHDLKTPVMVIMSHAEAIIDGMYVDSVEGTAEIIRDEAISLNKKIKKILYLNTLDYVLENNSENSDIDLQELLQHISSRLEKINTKIKWNLDLDKIIVGGNIDKVQVAIENILDNQLRYAEGEICITLKDEGNFAVLEMYNDGPHIAEEHINHIFDNFYKDKTGNFGLGLAITKKIIDFYRGNVKAINRNKGVSFIIKYPKKQ